MLNKTRNAWLDGVIHAVRAFLLRDFLGSPVVWKGFLSFLHFGSCHTKVPAEEVPMFTPRATRTAVSPVEFICF
jgi:hypothetical protein